MPSPRARLAVALAVALAAACIAWVKIQQNGLLYDFAYFWVAGRALLDGADPYAAVRPGVMHFNNGFMYPLPAAMVGAVFGWPAMHAASIAFVGTSFGALAFVLTREGWWRLPILMSAPALWSITAGQWAPLVMAAALSPAFAWAAVGKPTLGIAAFAYRPSWRFVAVGVGVVVVSLAIRPSWPLDWLAATQRAPADNYAIPILQPFGFLLALAAFRWRAPEGRVLLTMSCVPQSMLMYDQFPLLLLARTRLDAIAFALWSHVVPLGMRFVTDAPIGDDKPYLARIITWSLYLPALGVVLWRGRPMWSTVRERIDRDGPARDVA